jgi:hypothetical protein
VAVINTRISQSPADDHATAVDTEVHILPTTNALAAVFDSSPLTVAEAAETTAVDNQVDPAKLQRPQRIPRQ